MNNNGKGLKIHIYYILIVTLICLICFLANIFGKGLLASKEPEFESIPVSEVVKPEITVYITGAVKDPGLYTVEKGMRTDALVELAGGANVNADMSKVNLAKILDDGDHIKVPAVSVKAGTGTTKTSGSSTAKASVKVNLNCGEVDAYCKVSGITREIAENIVSHIAQNGPFNSVDELVFVDGVSEDTFNNVKNMFTIE